MKASTDLQYVSAHVNFLTSTGVDSGSLGAKLKKLLELVIGAFEIKVEIFVWKSAATTVWKLVKKARAMFFNLFKGLTQKFS